MKKLTVSKKVKFGIQHFVDQWEKMGKAYFFTPPSSASQRRSYESYNSMEYKAKINGVKYEGKIEVECSCRNIYATRILLVDGEQKRITALKKLLK